MVLTRSSRCETRSSAKKKALLDDPPKKAVHRPQAKKSTPVVAEVKRITSKPSKLRVTRGLKRRLEAQTEEITNNESNSKDSTRTSEESNVETDDNVPEDISCSQSVDFYATPHYETSLSERAQGNSFIKILVREYDEVSSVNIKLKNDSLKSNIRPEIVKAFQLLSKDSEYYRYLNEDRQLANLSIMPKQLIKDFNDKFDEFRKEALEDAQCRSNRLRPRGEKINYSILNGSKRKFLMDFRDDISRSGSNPSNNGSWRGKMKKKQRKRLEIKSHIDLTKETCHCGKCEDCIRADDAETDGCEMSDSGTVNAKHSIEIKSEPKFSPIERRRRNCTNNMINWKYCYDISSDLKKGVKRVKTNGNNEVVTPLKRLKTYPPDREKPAPKLTCKLSRENSPTPKEAKDIKKKIKTEGKHIESNNGNVEKVKEKVLIKKEIKIPEEKDSSKQKTVTLVDSAQEESDETPKSSPKKVHHEIRNSIPSTQNDEVEPNGASKEKLHIAKIEPKEILRGHIKKVVPDEQKIKIYGTPLTAELTEINNDQFYRLVVVLQGTDFIVKNAAMKNIRGPNETISQLYNCTVCHKDEIEEQNDHSKSHGSSSLSPKIERKEGIKLKSHVDSQKLPQIRPKVSSHLTSTIKHESSPYTLEKLQRRNRAKMIPKTQPHIVPRVQPQLAPKPVSKVLPVPQYEVQTPRVPPIIFPNHMKSAVSSECNISTSTNNSTSVSETVGQTSGRVVVKATCFQRRPKLEPLDSGSEDSDNLALDPDLKDRIISDITQAGKSIPDSRGLREALKRMGRRKTDPDIHPITRRMNKKVVRKMYTGNESLPNILKRTMATVPSGNSGIGSSPGSPIRSQSQITNSPTASNTNRPVSYKPFSSSTNSPQKVQLDNRGRYLDPYKPVERLEETPATALTASERLKLQKIDVAKKGSSVNAPESSSTSTTIPGTIKPSATKKEAESADESDFELGESTQPPIKAVVCTTATTIATTSTPTVSKVSPPSGPVHIKILPKPEGAATVRSVNISGKPGLHDKIGYRKILPRPEPSSSSPSPQNTSPPKAPVVTVSNLEATQDISNIQRRTSVDAEDSSNISPVKQQEREMLLLKSILRQKSPTTGNETIVVKQSKCETTQGRATITAVTAGSLRVPPASSYTTATATAVTTQTVKSPTPMRPITIRMTRVKNQPSLSGSVNGVVVDVQSKEGCEKSSGSQAN